MPRPRFRPSHFALAFGLFSVLAVPLRAADSLTLHRKALLFETDMVERFLIGDQLAPKLRPPRWYRPYVSYNMPDNAYMTGLYCAAQSWRYASTGDPEAKALAKRALRGLNHLLDVSGWDGLLARASMPSGMRRYDDGDWQESLDGKYRWRSDVSTDQIDGVMFGYYVYCSTVASEGELPEIALHVEALVNRILRDGYRITDFDGRLTEWSHYDLPAILDGQQMNALLMLQVLKVASFITHNARYEALYERLIERDGYGELAEGSRLAMDPREANHSDDVLIEIALYPLLELEKNPKIRAHYLAAEKQWWEGADGFPGVGVEMNPFSTFLHQHWTGDKARTTDAIEALRSVPLDMKWNRATIDAYAKRYDFTFDPKPSSPRPKRGQLIPMDRRSKDWSFLVMNPYYDKGDRMRDSKMEFQGLDFSISYWFGLAHGMIPEATIHEASP